MSIGVKVGLDAALGQIGDSLGKVGDGLDKLHKFMTANPRQSPIVRPLVATGIVDAAAATWFVIDLGGPAGGRLWDVRRVAIWRSDTQDGFTTVGSVTVGLVKITGGYIYNKSTAVMPPFTDMALAPSTIPNDANFSAHQLQVKPTEHLCMLLKGATANMQFVATGQAEEYLESAREEIVA